MSNMGYCRFQNTLADLRDCYDWLMDSEPHNLSGDERKSFERLVKLCRKIADDYDGSLQ